MVNMFKFFNSKFINYSVVMLFFYIVMFSRVRKFFVFFLSKFFNVVLLGCSLNFLGYNNNSIINSSFSGDFDFNPSYKERIKDGRSVGAVEFFEKKENFSFLDLLSVDWVFSVGFRLDDNWLNLPLLRLGKGRSINDYWEIVYSYKNIYDGIPCFYKLRSFSYTPIGLK